MKAIVFPGQGSQSRGMGGDLFSAYPALVEIADSILGYSVSALCMDDPDNLLNQTAYTQPALFVVNVLNFHRHLEGGHPTPKVYAGHSLGEYNALYAAGALSFEQGLHLVKKRGELMAEARGGAMAAILGLPASAVAEQLAVAALSNVDVANFNEPMQTVISGDATQVQESESVFSSLGARFIPLNTSGAFHSQQMAGAGREFEDFISSFNFSELNTPVISNVTARPYVQSEIKSLLVRQISSPVKWLQSISYILDIGVDDFEELGDSVVLSRMIEKIRRAPRERSLVEVGLSENLDRAEQIGDAKLGDAKSQIDHWNRFHPIGSTVYIKGDPQPKSSVSAALVLFGHRAAIYLDGSKGYFALDDLTA
ncbi:MAG: malonyl CoA-acyl carrier protein transacylase [Flavobacteriales bacterium]|jgi:malonyl CoA-acyl carrier protein transacylase